MLIKPNHLSIFSLGAKTFKSLNIALHFLFRNLKRDHQELKAGVQLTT